MGSLLARTNGWAWRLACVTLLCVYVSTVPRLWQCEGVDEIEYLSLAHSLAHGQGYTCDGEPHVLYPPLYPVLLSAVMRFDAGAWRWMYAMNGLLGALGMIAGASWLRSRFGTAGAVGGWMAILSYYSWSFSVRYLLAEPLFLAVSVPSLILTTHLLEEKKASPLKWSLAGICTLLAVMTRSGAVALVGGLLIAAIIHCVRRRTRTAVLVLLLVMVSGTLFPVAWELRGRALNPNATESYGRWATKFLGLSSEKSGMIASSLGEGTSGETTWAGRIIQSGVRCGRYVFSVVREPVNFAPAGLLIWGLVLTGLASHLRRDIGSPLAWYIIVSFVMISLTSWVSSYLRYFFPLAPFMFCFFAGGVQIWYRRLFGERDRGAWLVVGIVGAVGVAWSLAHGDRPDAPGTEGGYATALWWGCLLLYVALILGSLVVRKGDRRAAFVPPLAVAALVLFFGVHSAFLVTLREQRIRANESLESKNLAGVVAVGQWLRAHTPPSAVAVSSLPRLVAFLADRTSRAPGYNTDGTLNVQGVDYVVRMGEVREVPAFRPAADRQLGDSVVPLLNRRHAEVAFTAGGATAYRILKP